MTHHNLSPTCDDDTSTPPTTHTTIKSLCILQSDPQSVLLIQFNQSCFSCFCLLHQCFFSTSNRANIRSHYFLFSQSTHRFLCTKIKIKIKIKIALCHFILIIYFRPFLSPQVRSVPVNVDRAELADLQVRPPSVKEVVRRGSV
jgi:hypothetical protein